VAAVAGPAKQVLNALLANVSVCNHPVSLVQTPRLPSIAVEPVAFSKNEGF
jgi:hypothetical protein